MVDYDRQIARTALAIKAIKLWPKEGPFLWASGFHMPIYNDNRRFLANDKHREMVAEAMLGQIALHGLRPDIIAGTSTAGIAPAATLAQAMDLPLAIQQGGEVYIFNRELTEALSIRRRIEDADDIIVSTCPFGIPPAVMDANDEMLPFAYVRAEQKDHGLKRQIEGIVEEGQRAFLVDYRRDQGYAPIAQDVLEGEGVRVRSAHSRDISHLLRPADIRGRRILQVEDLVSTGGSCVKEIQRYREAGADVTHCLSIFSYQLEKALTQFRDADVTLLPALTYPVLLEEALTSGYVPGDSGAALEEWMAAPFEWGEKHGYPPKEK